MKAKLTDEPGKPPRPAFATDISEKGLEFVARWEGCVLHPYNDAVGYATIGVGHLIHYSHVTPDDVTRYKGFTYAQAIALLKQDAARYVLPVRQTDLHLAQNEFDALVSFAFNLGPGALSHIVQLIRAGDKPGAMNVLQQYDHAGGHVLEGLRRRRTAEAALFLHNTYGK